MPRCAHLETVAFQPPGDGVAGCEECIATGDRWLHLRMCASCGHVGCCDSSPNKHATAHHRETGHPIVSSAEPGEDWSFCYVDELMFRLPRA